MREYWNVVCQFIVEVNGDLKNINNKNNFTLQLENILPIINCMSYAQIHNIVKCKDTNIEDEDLFIFYKLYREKYEHTVLSMIKKAKIYISLGITIQMYVSLLLNKMK